MFFAIMRPFITLFLWLFYPFKVRGKENIINDGNTVIICNHLSKMDVPMVGYIFKGKTYYLAKQEWFDKKWRIWLFTKMGAIPIDREHPSLETMRTVIKLLKDDKRLCVFPEGTRSKTSTEIQQIHGGAGVFAFKTGAKIIPLNIQKHSKIWHKNSIYVGKAFDFSEFKGQKLDSELNEKLTQRIYEELCKAQQEHKELCDAENKKRIKK